MSAIYANLYTGPGDVPFGTVRLDADGSAVFSDVADGLLELALIDPTTREFVTVGDGEAYIRALPFAVRVPHVWAEVFDPSDEPSGDNDYDYDGDDDAGPLDDADDDTTNDDDADATRFHTPGGGGHNQKNHTRHGYVGANPTLAKNLSPQVAQRATAGQVIDTAQMKKVGGQGGSNPGGLYEDSAGQRWYVKRPQSGDVAAKNANELLAGKLYEVAGVPVAELRPARLNGQPGVASKIRDVEDLSPQQMVGKKGVVENFAVDAWLANWDVVGTGSPRERNLKRDRKTGEVVRLDTGGALLYRAQGAAKGAAFGNSAGEIDTMRDLSRSSGQVFGKMTPAQLRSSMDKVLKIPDAKIAALVRSQGPGSAAERESLLKTLLARKRDIARRREALEGVESFAEAAQGSGAVGADQVAAIWEALGFHTPGGKTHNQKNHTRHGYIRKNTKLATNVDTHIRKKNTVSAGGSSYNQNLSAKYLTYAKQAQAAGNTSDFTYYSNMATKATTVGQPPKAKLGVKIYTDQGRGKLVSVGKQGTWGVVEIEKLPSTPPAKGNPRVGKRVIVDFDKLGIDSQAPTAKGKSLEEQQAKKAVKAKAALANPPVAKVGGYKNAPKAVVGTTDADHAATFKPIEPYSDRFNEWNGYYAQNWKPKLTNPERSSVANYTGAAHHALNKKLRHDPTNAPLATVKRLDSAISKSATPFDTVVYRGTHHLPHKNLEVGQTFDDPGFSSHSIKYSVAQQFAGSAGSVFQVRVPKGTTGAFVKDVSKHGSEMEFILPRNAKFRIVSKGEEVTSFYHTSKRTVYTVDLVGDAD